MELTAYLPLNDDQLGITMHMRDGKLQHTLPIILVVTTAELERILSSSSTGTINIVVKTS